MLENRKTMTQILKFSAFVMVLVLVMGSSSCRSTDKDVVTPVGEVKKLLTAQTWQMNEVSEVQNGVSTVVYKRGAAQNEEDYSAVRQLFKADGSIVYTDQDGSTGADGRYELLDNDTSLKLSMPAYDLSVTVYAVKVTSGEFSYRLGTAEGYVLFTFGVAK